MWTKVLCFGRDRAVFGLTDGGAPGLEQEHDVWAVDWSGVPRRHGDCSRLGSANACGAAVKRCAAETALADRPSPGLGLFILAFPSA